MLDLLARTIETDDDFDVILYDISAEEIAMDLAGVEDLTETGLHDLLAEGTPDGRGNFSALIGLYTFEETPPHAELVGRIARLAAHLDAPFIARDRRRASWRSPRKTATRWSPKAGTPCARMPEAGHVALASPRFLLRRPYGKKTDPISEFDFEEFTETEGLAGMLWANPAVLVAILLAQSFRKNGKGMKLGSVMQLGEQPYHFVLDKYGDQVQLPCTERNVTQTRAVKVIERGYMPVLTIKGRDEIRLAAFVSLAGKILLGPWSSVPPPPPSPPSRAAQADASDDSDDDSGDDDLDALLAGMDDDSGSDSSGSGDDDLDALLAGMDDDSGSDDSAGSDDDDELAALLAGFDDETSDDDDSGGGDDDEMDPELAALLASL